MQVIMQVYNLLPIVYGLVYIHMYDCEYVFMYSGIWKVLRLYLAWLVAVLPSHSSTTTPHFS